MPSVVHIQTDDTPTPPSRISICPRSRADCNSRLLEECPGLANGLGDHLRGTCNTFCRGTIGVIATVVELLGYPLPIPHCLTSSEALFRAGIAARSCCPRTRIMH